MLYSYNLTQHVQNTTRGSNTLDLLLTSASDTGLLSRVAVQPTCFSDHDLVTCRLHVPCDPPTVAKYQYRDIRRIDIAAFQNDILQSPLLVLYLVCRPVCKMVLGEFLSGIEFVGP